MQIRRVLDGEEVDDEGFHINGKIKGIQRALTESLTLAAIDTE